MMQVATLKPPAALANATGASRVIGLRRHFTTWRYSVPC